MKNLKNTKNLSYLPRRESMINPDGWGKKGSTYHKVDGVWPCQRIKRLCEANIGKQFDKVFSEYCSQVPSYQQDFFLDEFRKKRYPNRFFVDYQGNIQKYKKPKSKKTVYFYSDDYKTERLHKITGAKYPAWGYRWLDKKFKDSDYKETVVRGYSIEFSSKKDPEYIRLTTDQRKRRKAAAKRKIKEKENQDYSVIFKSKKEKEEEKEKNKIKIESKGFDYLTSFRSDKAIHPDAIKEKRGF